MPQLLDFYNDVKPQVKVHLLAPTLSFDVAEVCSRNCSKQITVLKGYSSLELIGRMSKEAGSENRAKVLSHLNLLQLGQKHFTKKHLLCGTSIRRYSEY